MNQKKKWWQDPDLNWGHKAFQASALPTELSRHNKKHRTKMGVFVSIKKVDRKRSYFRSSKATTQFL